MNKKRILIITLIGIFISVLLFFCVNFILEKETKKYLEHGRTYLASLEEIKGKQVIYIINKGEGNVNEYRVEKISDKATVFSLLEELSLKEGFNIETTFYPEMGVFVKGISGFLGGTNNKWWQYYINDKLGEVAADKKEVKGGDKVEWRFEVPPQF